MQPRGLCPNAMLVQVDSLILRVVPSLYLIGVKLFNEFVTLNAVPDYLDWSLILADNSILPLLAYNIYG